jgi:hypothetical protein
MPTSHSIPVGIVPSIASFLLQATSIRELTGIVRLLPTQMGN